jgi:hypothetical protein
VGVGVADGNGVAVGEAAGVGSTGLIPGLTEGFGIGFTATPLFQTSFEPDLMQVNFLPATVDVEPTFVHLAPALTAANEGVVTSAMLSSKTRNSRNRFIA